MNALGHKCHNKNVSLSDTVHPLSQMALLSKCHRLPPTDIGMINTWTSKESVTCNKQMNIYMLIGELIGMWFFRENGRCPNMSCFSTIMSVNSVTARHVIRNNMCFLAHSNAQVAVCARSPTRTHMQLQARTFMHVYLYIS